MPSQIQPVEVVIHPDLVSRRSLPGLLERIQDYSPVLRSQIVPEIEDEFRFGFETRGFGQWAPLKSSTLRGKFRRGYDAEPLVRTGRLFRALTQEGPGHKVLVGPTSLQVGVFGAVVPYAAILDAGSPRRNLPARYLTQVRPQTRETLIQIIREWVAGPGGNPDSVSVYLGSPLSAQSS